MEKSRLEIDCAHGKGIASIVCCHLLNSVDSVGFIENNSDPDNLQAWCYACEFFFQQEEEMSEEFKNFNNAKVVCEKCYEELKNTHSIK
ncbi:hypothetical protein FRZ67_08520 [Panacibacter ginsenosidivorans]|uniref:Uncharacterized protein n=1 Tax=Panacibacter ginsenosidivorans TaxID=1813871 RepID=A0A5B8V9E1_9BACT|nr:hypothetical protein [Panacibacter ginsenosidivorans]QEC67336.1 hypothetical protein FRZ67_08520 [Panacibacter ginsenosidivorans]